MLKLNKSQINNILKKAQKYTNLWANPDFQGWRKDIVKGDLKRLQRITFKQDVSTSEGQKIAIDNIRLYQLIEQETEGIFKFWDVAEKQARKKLKE